MTNPPYLAKYEYPFVRIVEAEKEPKKHDGLARIRFIAGCVPSRKSRRLSKKKK